MARCLFCAREGPLTKEHVIPRWVRDVHPPGPGGVRTTGARGESGTHGAPASTFDFTGRTYDLSVRAVCASCNNGWMSALEGRAMPVLTQLINGQATTLDARAQITVARWALKTVMVSRAREATHHVPVEHRHVLRHDGGVPAAARVWVGAAEPGPSQLIFLRDYGFVVTAVATDDEFLGYSGTVAIGHLLLQVFGHDPREELSVSMSKARSSALREILPLPGAETVWPPRMRVGPNALPQLAASALPASGTLGSVG